MKDKKYNFNGKMLTIKEASEEFEPHFKPDTIRSRISKGMDPYEAATRKSDKATKFNFAKNDSYEEWLSCYDAAIKFHSSVCTSTIFQRIKYYHMTPYEAATKKNKKDVYNFAKDDSYEEWLSCREAEKKFKQHVEHKTIKRRIENGWKPYEAATTKTKKDNKPKIYNFNGKMLTIKEASEEFEPHINPVTIKARIQKGMDPYEAATKVFDKNYSGYNFFGKNITAIEAGKIFKPKSSYQAINRRMKVYGASFEEAILYYPLLELIKDRHNTSTPRKIKDFEIVRFSFTNNKGIDYFECIYHEEKMFLSDTEIREIWSSKFRELNKDFFDNLEKDNKHE